MSISRSTARSAELMSANGDGAIEDERLDLAERAAEHAGDVRLLVAFGELDRFA
jgi:hypothetical protein